MKVVTLKEKQIHTFLDLNLSNFRNCQPNLAVMKFIQTVKISEFFFPLFLSFGFQLYGFSNFEYIFFIKLYFQKKLSYVGFSYSPPYLRFRLIPSIRV